MKKLGIVLGVAAVASLVGCKDPNYRGNMANNSNKEVKYVAQNPAPQPPPAPAKKLCSCLPGTKHTAPCACGGENCACVVEKPAPVVPVKPVESEYTYYIVQRGDYLAKISKKFNIRVDSIRKLNPSIKKDVVRIGQKIKLPGKVEVGKQEVPRQAAPAKAQTKKAFTPYSGETKEYAVKSGDTLGSIAYGAGINIRQLKALNQLKSDRLRIGQKLKVPAAKVVAEKKVVEEKKPDPIAPAPVTSEVAPAPVVDAAAPAPAADEAAPVPAVDATATPAPVEDAQEVATHVVQEGEDMTAVAVKYSITSATIRDMNNLPEDAQLVPGQVIKIPAAVQQQ